MQYGRRRLLTIMSLPFSLSWILTVFAKSVETMFATAFLGGFCCAIVSMVTQVTNGIKSIIDTIRYEMLHHNKFTRILIWNIISCFSGGCVVLNVQFIGLHKRDIITRHSWFPECNTKNCWSFRHFNIIFPWGISGLETIGYACFCSTNDAICNCDLCTRNS